MRGHDYEDNMKVIKITKKQYEIIQQKRGELMTKLKRLPAIHEVIELLLA